MEWRGFLFLCSRISIAAFVCVPTAHLQLSAALEDDAQALAVIVQSLICETMGLPASLTAGVITADQSVEM